MKLVQHTDCTVLSSTGLSGLHSAVEINSITLWLRRQTRLTILHTLASINRVMDILLGLHITIGKNIHGCE